MYDLTQSLTPAIPRFPGDPEIRIEVLPGMAPWQVSALAMGSHSGTHMDAPCHRIAGGRGIGAFGPERLVGRGMVVDARGFGENEAISVAVLDGLRGRLWPGWFAMICTGWDRYWGDERYFRHPFLSSALAAELVALQVGLVAVDALSVDSTVDDGEAAHLVLLGSEVLIAENLCNLSALDENQIYAIAALPLALSDADGSPARVIAWTPGSYGV